MYTVLSQAGKHCVVIFESQTEFLYMYYLEIKGWFKHAHVLLFVSFQFTLSAVLKGNKPDFHEAMGPDTSENAYQDFLQMMRNSYHPDKIKGIGICILLI